MFGTDIIPDIGIAPVNDRITDPFSLDCATFKQLPVFLIVIIQDGSLFDMRSIIFKYPSAIFPFYTFRPSYAGGDKTVSAVVFF